MSELHEEYLSETIEKIESSYEFMLAYAAQGRETENTDGGGGPSIRKFLKDLQFGLENIVYALAEKIELLELNDGAFNALDEFKNVLADDAGSALKALTLVQSVPSISSQLIDNLNASAHLRCLLTDIFVIDEALKGHSKGA